MKIVCLSMLLCLAVAPPPPAFRLEAPVIARFDDPLQALPPVIRVITAGSGDTADFARYVRVDTLHQLTPHHHHIISPHVNHVSTHKSSASSSSTKSSSSSFASDSSSASQLSSKASDYVVTSSLAGSSSAGSEASSSYASDASQLSSKASDYVVASSIGASSSASSAATSSSAKSDSSIVFPSPAPDSSAALALHGDHAISSSVSAASASASDSSISSSITGSSIGLVNPVPLPLASVVFRPSVNAVSSSSNSDSLVSASSSVATSSFDSGSSSFTSLSSESKSPVLQASSTSLFSSSSDDDSSLSSEEYSSLPSDSSFSASVENAYIAPPGEAEEQPAFMPYNFEYNIESPNANNYQSHVSVAKDEFVTGEYSVVEPNGDLRIVTYTAGKDGFNAKVTYKRAYISLPELARAKDGSLIVDDSNTRAMKRLTENGPIIDLYAVPVHPAGLRCADCPDDTQVLI